MNLALELPWNAPTSASTVIALVSMGVALGFLIAYLRCRATTRCPQNPSISFGDRIVTLLWSIAAGLFSTIGGHWLLTNADRIVPWIAMFWRGFS